MQPHARPDRLWHLPPTRRGDPGYGVISDRCRAWPGISNISSSQSFAPPTSARRRSSQRCQPNTPERYGRCPPRTGSRSRFQSKRCGTGRNAARQPEARLTKGVIQVLLRRRDASDFGLACWSLSVYAHELAVQGVLAQPLPPTRGRSAQLRRQRERVIGNRVPRNVALEATLSVNPGLGLAERTPISPLRKKVVIVCPGFNGADSPEPVFVPLVCSVHARRPS